MAQWIDLAPKTELHVHLEGTLEPHLLLELGARNDVRLPWNSVEEVREAYLFEGLEAFLPLLWQAASVLRTRRDFYDLTMGYLRHAVADHVVRAEVFFGPQTFLDLGVPIAWQLEGVLAAIDDAHAEWGIDTALMLTAQRHRDQSAALELLDLVEPWAGRILGFGLGGAERGNPPTKFLHYFESARERGFRTTCHAGEDGPAEYIRQALEVCRVERIDHGTAAVDDPDLVAQLADRDIALTMCPLSNDALRVVTLRDHPIAQLLAAGVKVTVNSDDPPYFGGYVNDNFHALAEHRHLSDAQLSQLLHNGFEGSFLHGDGIRHHQAALDRYLRNAARLST